MQVRFGTMSGLNTVHISHWTYAEEVLEPPPPAGLEQPVADDTFATQLPALPEEGGVALAIDVSPSSAPPAPVATTTPVVTKTLTVYMIGRSDPLVYVAEEATALLGVFVSQSGSII